LNEQLDHFERHSAWLTREYLRLFKLRQTARVRRALNELALRSDQLTREWNQFLERNEVNLPETLNPQP
jgi:ABC-type transporter Mla subunit MlaD